MIGFSNERTASLNVTMKSMRFQEEAERLSRSPPKALEEPPTTLGTPLAFGKGLGLASDHDEIAGHKQNCHPWLAILGDLEHAPSFVGWL